jgi:diadenosine tetraphosphatase ApaH/serine/threonine PP2A family protein phosphatase
MVHAILSDLHGNLEALEAVLADLERVGPESIVCLGDFVGYGASPNECIERLRPRLAGAVVGNHDLAACGRIALGGFNADAAAAARWTDVALSPGNRAYLEALPFALEWEGALLVHAAPAAPGEWRYVLSPPDAKAEMSASPLPLCFIGHSHYAGAFDLDGGHVRYTRAAEIRLEPDHRYLVNVGSVGQPRDGDPRAAYLSFDPAARVLRHVRVEYDVDGAMRRIVAAGLPEFLAERLRWGE